MFKFTVTLLCLVQIAFGAPASPPQATTADQLTAQIAAIQQQAAAAVATLNAKFLEVAGLKTNEELVNSVAAQSQTFSAQLKGTAEQINQQVASQKVETDVFVQGVANRISETAANLAGPQNAQFDQIKSSFDQVLVQANQLNAQLQQQGANAQAALANTIENLFQNTLQSAKQIATQLDASIKKN